VHIHHVVSEDLLTEVTVSDKQQFKEKHELQFWQNFPDSIAKLL